MTFSNQRWGILSSGSQIHDRIGPGCFLCTPIWQYVLQLPNPWPLALIFPRIGLLCCFSCNSHLTHRHLVQYVLWLPNLGTFLPPVLLLLQFGPTWPTAALYVLRLPNLLQSFLTAYHFLMLFSLLILIYWSDLIYKYITCILPSDQYISGSDEWGLAIWPVY